MFQIVQKFRMLVTIELLPKGVNKVARGERYSVNPWEMRSGAPFAPQRGATPSRCAPPLVAYFFGGTANQGIAPRRFFGAAHPRLPCFTPLGYFACDDPDTSFPIFQLDFELLNGLFFKKCPITDLNRLPTDNLLCQQAVDFSKFLRV